MIKKLLLLIFFTTTTIIIFAQQSYRPSLFFREDWKEIPAEVGISEKHLNNSNLILNLYGAGKDSLKKSHHDRPDDDPYYVWSGLCLKNWMITLKHRNKNVDLTEFAKLRWRTKQFGLRQLHITVKLADGTWLISDLSDGPSKDWRIKEFNIQDIKWHKFDPVRVVEIGVAGNPDLSNVEEIGFTDLMPGGMSNACSRLDWIEVYGKPVSRQQ